MGQIYYIITQNCIQMIGIRRDSFGSSQTVRGNIRRSSLK